MVVPLLTYMYGCEIRVINLFRDLLCIKVLQNTKLLTFYMVWLLRNFNTDEISSSELVRIGQRGVATNRGCQNTTDDLEMSDDGVR